MTLKSIQQRAAIVAIPLVLALATGCKKEFDSPPVRTIPTGSVVTIAQLKAMYQGTPVHFPETVPADTTGADTVQAITTLYAVVTADEQNGNLYKNLYIQDHTGAMAIRLLNSGGLYQGDSIRIYLPGTVLSPYNGLMQLDSVNVDNNVVKQATGVQVTPRPTQISELTAQNFGLGGAYQGMVIRLENVQFVAGDTSQTYANAVTQQTLNRTLENCAGQTAVVRSSGYANFAGQKLPKGKGSFTGVASWFGSAAQLYIRDINEVQLNGPRCGENNCEAVASLSQDFSTVVNNTSIDLECWKNTFTQGSFAWRGKVSGSDYSAEARRSSFDATSTMWLVTPQITATTASHLSFKSAKAGTGEGNLTLWLSTNFNSDPAAATWTAITGATLAGIADADNAWVGSGTIDLAGFLPSGYTGNFVIAFKYQGDAANSTTYRVDDVLVN